MSFREVKKRFDGFKLVAFLRPAVIYEHTKTSIGFWIDRNERSTYFDLRYGYLNGLEKHEKMANFEKYVRKILIEISRKSRSLEFKWKFEKGAHVPMFQITFPSKNLKLSDVAKITSFAEGFEEHVGKEYEHLVRLSIWEWFTAIFEEPPSLILGTLGQDETQVKEYELAWIKAQLNTL